MLLKLLYIYIYIYILSNQVLICYSVFLKKKKEKIEVMWWIERGKRRTYCWEDKRKERGLQREREATNENIKEEGVDQIKQAMGLGIAHFFGIRKWWVV